MNIKERIKTIIEDYSFAKDEANVRNKIKRTYKGPSEATESLRHHNLTRRQFYVNTTENTDEYTKTTERYPGDWAEGRHRGTGPPG